MKSSFIHVVHHHDGTWKVKRAGQRRAVATYLTQAAAIDRGRKIAQHEETEIIVHSHSGQIESRDSYGHDPYPPKG